jgi:hypothetical protein
MGGSERVEKQGFIGTLVRCSVRGQRRGRGTALHIVDIGARTIRRRGIGWLLENDSLFFLRRRAVRTTHCSQG